MGGYVSAVPYVHFYLEDDVAEKIKEYAPQINEIDRVQFMGSGWEDNWEAPFKKHIKEYYKHLILKRKEIWLRLYSFFEERPFDMNWIEDLTEIENLSIESRGEILNIEKLANFKNLKKLSLNFGAKIKNDLSFLTQLNPNLEVLYIAVEDKNPKVDLTPITHFKNLKKLSIQYFEKNLERILPEFPQLKELDFRSISKIKNLDCLENLQNLESVVLQLCGFENIDVFSKLKKIQYLQLWRLPKIENLDFVSQMAGLQFLFIETMNGVTKFPDVSKLEKLRRVKITSCKNINDFSQVAHSQSLTDFIIQNVTQPDMRIFLPIIENKNIKNLGIGYMKTSLEKEMIQLAKNHGKEKIFAYGYPDFEQFVFE